MLHSQQEPEMYVKTSYFSHNKLNGFKVFTQLLAFKEEWLAWPRSGTNRWYVQRKFISLLPHQCLTFTYWLEYLVSI